MPSPERSPGKAEAAHWHDTSGPTRPVAGEQVWVRERYESEPKLVVFRATPVERWESPDGTYVYQFRFFSEWRDRRSNRTR